MRTVTDQYECLLLWPNCKVVSCEHFGHWWNCVCVSVRHKSVMSIGCVSPRDEQCVLECCPARTGLGQLPPLGWHLIGLLSAFGCLSLFSFPSLYYSIYFHSEMLPVPTYPNPAVSLSVSFCPHPSITHSSLPPTLRHSRGIDWWSQPLISPPSSYLLFPHTLS